MASNLLLSSSSKSSKLTSNEKANMVDLLVKCGTEIKNQSVAALGSFCNKYESSSTSIPPLLPAAPEMPSPAAAPLSTETPCRLKSAVSSLCRSLPSASGFSGSSSSSSFQFIDPSELMRSLYEITKRPFLILLDCRPRTEFNNQHIKDSVHLNCRDKLIKKRLQMQKITIRDLISCELTKSKLDSALETTNNTTTTDIPTHDASSVITSNNESSETTASSSHFRVLTSSSSSFPLDLTSAFCSRSQLQHQQEQQQDNSEKENQQEANNCQQDATDENIIVIYDDTTSDDKDLLVESNPLKIVQENIRKAGIRKECKILKGGFKQFAAMCPDLCRSELKKSNLCNPSSYYYEQLQDQHQSMIDNTQMTEITPYLYLGNEMDAKNVSRLAQNGIYYILNVTKNIPFYDLPSSITADTAACDGVESSNSNNNTNKNASASKFVFKRIAVNDSINQSLKEYFDETFEFIEEARRKNAKVLVHCQAGVSRSPTIVIAYLMRLLGISMSDAYNRVRELRPIVAPNIVFWSQLTDYEVKLKAQQFSHRFTNCASHNNLANSLDEVTNPSEKNSSTEANKSAIECN